MHAETSSLLARHRSAALLRQTNTLLRLQVGIKGISTRDWNQEALVVRGSLSRGDFCSQSDIDLVLLADDSALEPADGLLRKLELLSSSLGRRLSVDFWNYGTLATRSRSIAFWLGAVEARILAGDTDFFLRCRGLWLDTLRRTSASALFEMRGLDMRRHWNLPERHSPLGMNIKRAEGGLVDCDFVNLIRNFCFCHKPLLCECQVLFDASKRIRDQLFLIKSLIYDITASPRESALLSPECPHVPSVLSPNRVAYLLDSQKDILEVLKEKLKCGPIH